MAIDKSKGKKEKKEVVDHEIKVTRAHEFKSGDIGFDAIVNGIKLYNMVYMDTGEGRKNDKPFISFPSRKSDDDKYYNHYYVAFSENDMDAIEKGIEGEL